ncbi:MAG: URC4/urg3 family protein [Proteobacteria bacterium]|nr:URC4/urg3 family protein [Pseudomonadota bacterium]MCA0424217.1 URC4/urg3 family protein [Pseudomonadota bacterium]
MTPAQALLTPAAVRARAAEMLRLGLDGQLAAFTVNRDRLPATAARVVETIRRNYPTLDIPFHARWRHFTFGGHDLWSDIAPTFGDPAERARAAFDLAIVSVLLDAGAGMAWRFSDPGLGLVSSRSEGLALASFRMFESGAFSAYHGKPLRADAARLCLLEPRDIAAGFQVSETNPLVGVEGRAGLLNALGRAVAALPGGRPGGLFDILVRQGKEVAAPTILAAVLEYLGPIWPSRIVLEGLPLGDTWRHPLIAGGDPSTAGLVPFHKLSQWLSYSLIEPLQAAGCRVTEVDGLTGLPEYRNGGLFVDMGVLVLRDPSMASAANTVDSLLVVEWRALTVALLDEIAPLVRAELGLSAEVFPLARVLEGGTWATGRELAAAARADGGSPIRIVSDGTVF